MSDYQILHGLIVAGFVVVSLAWLVFFCLVWQEYGQRIKDWYYDGKQRRYLKQRQRLPWKE